MGEEPKENPEEKPLSLKEYNDLAAQDMLTPFNEYVTGRFINRPLRPGKTWKTIMWQITVPKHLPRNMFLRPGFSKNPKREVINMVI